MVASAASSAMRRSSRVVIDRVKARVFCHLEDQQGGNPVTIFSAPPDRVLSTSTQQRLAQECDWESVMIHRHNHNQKPKLSFYMPSGEQVSFCAHAAMGASLELCLQSGDDTLDEVSFCVANLLQGYNDNNEPNNQQQQPQQEYFSTIYDGDIVALHMTAPYIQTRLSQPPMLFRMLREYCDLDVNDLAITPSSDTKKSPLENPFDDPSRYRHILCHGSIARPKTLIPLRTVDDLHQVMAPPSAASQGFALSCKALDDTTGLYLYAKSTEEDGTWECRQFPRSSGYAEDPATGIAAAALACHLYYEHDIQLPAYKLYQGTAMGKPSLIVVDELELKHIPNTDVGDADANANGSSNEGSWEASFRLLGRIEIDERDNVEITNDDDEGDEV